MLSFQDGRVLDGGGIVVLVEAAGNKDGGGEESKLDERPPLCRGAQQPGDVGKDSCHQPWRSLVPLVSPTAHLGYAFALLPLPLLPVGAKFLVILFI